MMMHWYLIYCNKESLTDFYFTLVKKVFCLSNGRLQMLYGIHACDCQICNTDGHTEVYKGMFFLFSVQYFNSFSDMDIPCYVWNILTGVFTGLYMSSLLPVQHNASRISDIWTKSTHTSLHFRKDKKKWTLALMSFCLSINMSGKVLQRQLEKSCHGDGNFTDLVKD